MLRDTDAACVPTALAVCIKKGKESQLGQCYKQTTINVRKSHDGLNFE